MGERPASSFGQASVVLQNGNYMSDSVNAWPIQAGESLGVTLTAAPIGHPCRIDAIQLLVPAGPTKSFEIEIYDDSGAHASPNLGALLWTSSNLFPSRADWGVSKIDLTAESRPIIRSGSIRVALFLAEPLDSIPLHLATDTSIGVKRNWFRNDVGQCKYWESLGGNCDWIILARVTVFAAGDFQEDLDVDGNDLTVWRVGFGASGAATHLQGDADGDHDIEGAEFLVWQRQFGSGPAAARATLAVPEPVTLFVLVDAMLIICSRLLTTMP